VLVLREEELDITKENLLKWGYDKAYYFYEDGNDSDVLYLCTDYIQEFLQLADDPNCVQHEQIHDSLFEMARESFRDRIQDNIETIENNLEDNPINPWVVQWQKYVQKLLKFYNSNQPISKEQALELADDLIIEKVEEIYNITVGRFSYTGNVVSGFHEIAFSEGSTPGYVEEIEYLYVNLKNSKWEYKYMSQLDEIKI